MSQSKLHPEYLRQKALQEALLARKNHKSDRYNGIYDRWDYPVLTREHIPLEWRFDLDPASNPDLSAAVAAAGIVRTRDLKTWERLPNLVTLRSPQQRNVDLLPEFVNGRYAFYTRPMDDFIDTGSGGGIGFGLCADITHPVIDEEIITSPRRYHTITEAKNGEGAPPIRTDKGWLHIAHGVRSTAAGLRYVVYLFVTDLAEPWKVIAEPSGFLIAPREWERVGDVSNVVFTNGAIARDNGELYMYYAASDTRLHVASTTVDRMLDFAFHTPADPLRSRDCVAQRCALIARNRASPASPTSSHPESGRPPTPPSTGRAPASPATPTIPPPSSAPPTAPRRRAPAGALPWCTAATS